MRWKRVVAPEEQRCSVRGCVISQGDSHWLKTWRRDRSSPWIESVYCDRCARGSRCDAGYLKLGPAIILMLALLCFVVLPLVWPGHRARYVGAFLLLFVATAVGMARLRFWRPWRRQRPTCTLLQFKRSIVGA